MTELLLLDGPALQAALPMHRAIDAMSEALVLLAAGAADVPPRVHLPHGEGDGAAAGTTMVMGGRVEERALGAKLVSVQPSNRRRGLPLIHGLVVLLDPVTGAPAALLDGTFLTAWRTGAVAGLGARLLAREDATVGAVVGAGPQARTQVLALDAVRALAELRVYGRTRARAEALVEALQPRTRARLVVADSVEAAVRGADVIGTATPATAPVLEDAWVADGAHVSAVGSFRPSMRELAPALVDRAQVFVDRREDALHEAGELIEAAGRDPDAPGRWTELGRVAAGTVPGRRSEDAVTLFKSVGNAVQDLVAGAHALEAARALGLGRALAWDPSELLDG